ncbi:MAG TPA: 3-oxoacyl-ACP reductase FabG [Oligoflexia bacterium]|nr:3-oxoacyl-ACP reductase FabG [Oligoflexia bacterium]
MKPQVLITGGSRGIGKAICETLAAGGYEVALTYRSSSSALAVEQFAKTLSERHNTRVEAFGMDISQTSSIDQAAETILSRFGNLTGIVNNAGLAIDGLFARFRPEQFDEILNTNLRGAYFVTQAFLRPLLKARSGSVVFISSVVGQSGNAGQSAYSAAKAGLLGVAKSLALELASRNIRVNAVTPGFIETDMTGALPEATKQAILPKIPLGAFGSPKDVAGAVAFLLGPDSRYITGQVLAVNGGMYM